MTEDGNSLFQLCRETLFSSIEWSYCSGGGCAQEGGRETANNRGRGRRKRRRKEKERQRKKKGMGGGDWMREGMRGRERERNKEVHVFRWRRGIYM